MLRLMLRLMLTLRKSSKQRAADRSQIRTPWQACWHFLRLAELGHVWPWVHANPCNCDSHDPGTDKVGLLAGIVGTVHCADSVLAEAVRAGKGWANVFLCQTLSLPGVHLVGRLQGGILSERLGVYENRGPLI